MNRNRDTARRRAQRVLGPTPVHSWVDEIIHIDQQGEDEHGFWVIGHVGPNAQRFLAYDPAWTAEATDEFKKIGRNLSADFAERFGKEHG
jgi:hypothetical protein